MRRAFAHSATDDRRRSWANWVDLSGRAWSKEYLQGLLEVFKKLFERLKNTRISKFPQLQLRIPGLIYRTGVRLWLQL